MPTPEQMIETVHAYIAAFANGGADQAAALFADDATVEDPIGTDPRQGREAIHAFYTQAMMTGAQLTLQGPIRVAANHAAFAFTVTVAPPGLRLVIDVIDIFTFDDTGKISAMRAFWGPQNMQSQPA